MRAGPRGFAAAIRASLSRQRNALALALANQCAHDRRVAGAHKAEQCIELRALRVLARHLVDKDAIPRDIVELTLGVLLERADPHIADTLTVHDGRATRGRNEMVRGGRRPSRRSPVP